MNSQHQIWYSDKLNLQECFCAYLNSEAGQKLSTRKSYGKRDFIYFNNDNADKLYFIHKGAVKIIGYTDDGQEVIKALLHKGEIFGDFCQKVKTLLNCCSRLQAELIVFPMQKAAGDFQNRVVFQIESAGFQIHDDRQVAPEAFV